MPVPDETIPQRFIKLIKTEHRNVQKTRIKKKILIVSALTGKEKTDSKHV